MHDSAMMHGKMFFDTYVTTSNIKVVDIGSLDVNGSLRSVCPSACEYVGLDFVEGKGVDIVIKDPYVMPLSNETADVVVCSSCFEHSEFFWVLFNEILRILKPNGLLYLNVPANGLFHRYPVDCWRMYPDAGIALQNWGRRSGYNCELLESFTGNQMNSGLNDFVAIFLKDREHLPLYSKRMLDSTTEYKNGKRTGSDILEKYSNIPDDHRGYMRLKLLMPHMLKALQD